MDLHLLFSSTRLGRQESPHQSKAIERPPTYYGQSEGQTNFGLCRHLALVDPAVLLLDVANLQLPVMRTLNVLGLEALVVGVRHDTYGENVQVPFPDP